MANSLGNAVNQYQLWRDPIAFLPERNLDLPDIYGQDSRSMVQFDENSIFTRFVTWYQEDLGCLQNFGRIVAKIAAVVAVVLTSVIGIGIWAGYQWHQTARQIDQSNWNRRQIYEVNTHQRHQIYDAIGFGAVESIPVATIPQSLVRQIEYQHDYDATENQGLRYDVTESQELRDWLESEFNNNNAHALQGLDPYGRAYLAVRVVDDRGDVHYGMLHQLYRECDAERGRKWYGSGVLAHNPSGSVEIDEYSLLTANVRGLFNTQNSYLSVHLRIIRLFHSNEYRDLTIRLAAPNA